MILLAAYSGNLAMLKFAIETNKMDPSFQHPSGQTALHMAVKHKRTAIVESLIPDCPLLQHHRLMLQADNEGNTALHYAAVGGNKDFLTSWIACQLPFTARNVKGKNALHIAAGIGDSPFTILLLQHIGDPYMQDVYGNNAFHLAAVVGNGAFVASWALKKDDLSCRTLKGEMALHFAIKHNNMKVVKRLLPYRELALQADDAGNNGMHYAADGGNNELLQIWITWDLPLTARNLTGMTSLQVAVGAEESNTFAISFLTQ